MRRRTALIGAAAVATVGTTTPRGSGSKGVAGALMGADSTLGHLLRDGGLPEPSSTATADVVIVGGGIAGLSAAWWLRKRGIDDICLLDLEAEPGGNARSGRNDVSAYPWGAHYVPPLTDEARHARMLFEELGIIIGTRPDGTPVYDPLILCSDPQERLFLLGRWQEDLLPQLGASATDRAQFAAFLAAMDGFRDRRGADGKRFFAIPVDSSSADGRDLDGISMTDWMTAHGFSSERLLWYVDYCCRDDFGTHARDVSAWAGIHYFAAREVHGRDDAMLTWPEGNGYLAHRLAALAGPCTTSALAYRVQPDGDRVHVSLYEPATGHSRRISARAAVLATPRFVADRLLGQASDPARSYAPWMVANVTLDRMPEGRGAALAWDNVIYGSPSLGYVVATHQSLERVPRQTVLTYYWALCDDPPAVARRKAIATPLAAWQDMVLHELLEIHPELEGAVRRVDVWLWGHGMVRPTVGSMWGRAREAACRQAPPVFFAHSDMSGVSLFEEANERGVLAADAVAAYLRA